MRAVGSTAFFGAVSGFLCVAVGAFWEPLIQDQAVRNLVDTAARYHIMHTMAAFASVSFRNWGSERARLAPAFFFAGILVYCGSTYLKALGAPIPIMGFAPLGGFLFLTGWGLMAWAGLELFSQSLRGARSDGEPVLASSANRPLETAADRSRPG